MTCSHLHIRFFLCGHAAQCHGRCTAPGRCEVLRQFLEVRAQSNLRNHHELQAFAAEWLPRLRSHANDPSCGGASTASVGWHAMALANQAEQWDIASSFAIDGVRMATNRADRALWQMNLAGAAYHSITPSDNNTIRPRSTNWIASSCSPPIWPRPQRPVPTRHGYFRLSMRWCGKPTASRRLDDRIGGQYRTACGNDIRRGWGSGRSTFGRGSSPKRRITAAVDYAIIGRPAEAAGCPLRSGSSPTPSAQPANTRGMQRRASAMRRSPPTHTRNSQTTASR